MPLKKLLSLAVSAAFTSSVFAAPQASNPLADLPFYNATSNGYSLDFEGKNHRPLTAEIDGKTVQFRAFEKIVYVQNPVLAEYQTLNFYVPEAYFHQGEINGFNAQTAPIFMPNAVGGYMPAIADVPQNGRDGKPNAIIKALSKGYVVASVGARGRTQQNSAQEYVGKAPSVIIDLKSAVRYLHKNDAKMAGDANKIISNGTSAGGALSALLGVSGDSPDYAPYFKQLGAADASDAIFAASIYCPITNLEHADMAYEWEFNGLNQYSRVDFSKLNADTFNNRNGKMPMIEGSLTEEEIALSNQLKPLFPAYLNSLNLTDKTGKALTLDANGNGTFKDYLTAKLAESATQAAQNGENFANVDWVKVENGKARVDWNGYIHSELRQKQPPAFDAKDLSSAENQLFGNEKTDRRHFSHFAAQYHNGGMAEASQVKLMNAMNYVDNKGAAEHFRIRVGSKDRDTSHAISAMLALKLEAQGKNVDYFIPWGVPHSGDYDLDELFQWADKITKAK